MLQFHCKDKCKFFFCFTKISKLLNQTHDLLIFKKFAPLCNLLSNRYASTESKIKESYAKKKITVTLVPGDGVGPELMLVLCSLNLIIIFVL